MKRTATGKRANQAKNKRNKRERDEDPVTEENITLEESKAMLLKDFEEMG